MSNNYHKVAIGHVLARMGDVLVICLVSVCTTCYIDDGNNDQVNREPPADPYTPRGNHRPVEPQGPMGPVSPVYMKLHVKYPILSEKDDEDAESHLLCRNDWMNSQGIAEEAKCGRPCLTLGGDVHL